MFFRQSWDSGALQHKVFGLFIDKLNWVPILLECCLHQCSEVDYEGDVDHDGGFDDKMPILLKMMVVMMMMMIIMVKTMTMKMFPR